MTDLIIIAILFIIVGGASAYIIKAKKSGRKCIGCPHSESCSQKKTTDTDCGCGCCNNK